MPCIRASLSIGALLGNLEGVRLPGLVREKYIWVPFLDPEAIKILSLGGGGKSGTLVKERGSPELLFVYGAKRGCL